MTEQPTDVTVIGLGTMGSALAHAFLEDGYDVTVWNRTTEKAERVVEDGAVLASDPASAIAASPVVVVCVSDYDASRDILFTADVRPHLSGTVVVQLSSGTPQEARDMAGSARDGDAEYLDGSIQTYPAQMGSPEGGILVAGSETTFHRCESLLGSLATLSYVGEEVGLASALGLASGSVLFGVLLGTLHGARICEAEGLSVSEFGTLLTEFMPTLGGAAKDLCERIEEERYGESQATLRTSAGGAEILLQQARQSQIDAGLPEYVATTLRTGMDAGLGDEDLAALIEVLRGRS